MLRKILFCSLFVLLVGGFSLIADDQYGDKPSTDQQTTTEEQSATEQHMTKSKAGNVTVTAKLVDETTLSAQKMASLDVTVNGTRIASKGAHVHYQLDNGPIIATSDTNLMFANLSPGSHTISISVASPKHEPLSDPQTITFNIPQ